MLRQRIMKQTNATMIARRSTLSQVSYGQSCPVRAHRRSPAQPTPERGWLGNAAAGSRRPRPAWRKHQKLSVNCLPT